MDYDGCGIWSVSICKRFFLRFGLLKWLGLYVECRWIHSKGLWLFGGGILIGRLGFCLA